MDFGAILSQYGLAGAIIFALACVVVYQYKEKRADDKAHRAETSALYDRLLTQQELRRTEDVEKSERVTKMMSDFTETTNLLIDKIVVAKRKG